MDEADPIRRALRGIPGLRPALRYLQRDFQLGPVTRYYRNTVRPRILETPPVSETTDEACEIHVLTCDADWLNLMWTLKSFYHFSPRRFALCIHADPTLGAGAIDALESHFPDARVVRHDHAQREVLPWLNGYPRCQALRESSVVSMQLFDFLYFARPDRLAPFDSDLIFFGRPDGWLAYVENEDERINVFNADEWSAYTMRPSEFARHGIDVADDVNSGFGLVHKASAPLDWIEEFLAIPGIHGGDPWVIEQTLYALCSTRFGMRLLPDEYRLVGRRRLGDRPFRHYIGPVRHLMYTQGMRKLQKVLL